VTKPLAIVTRLDDQDFLAQLEAVDRFTDNMIAYPGRTFGQLYHRFVRGNALVTGSIDFGDRTISVADITAPVLVFGGATDGIAPIPAVRTVVPLLTGAKEVRFEVVPGGHLGMLTGRRARGTTWQIMDEWISKWSSEETPTPTARKKAAPKKSSAKKAPTRRTAASREAIGTNPARRYGSAGSRSLST
jgi:polyhydroxyalkanoate synthase subunit PhaC